VEDGQTHSFAGQFKTLLDVQGVPALLDAIEAVWASAEAPTVKAYLQRVRPEADRLRMAVILQDMVCPVVSGVAFSKNPLTGLDEVIVEAVQGRGDLLVQDGVTPGRWVNKWGNWLARPEVAPVDEAVIAHVIAQTKAIAKAHGQPVDLEWVYDGNEVYWVQLRTITALNQAVYSNRIAKEVLPGLIKPLVWSVNVPLVNGAWVKLLTEMVGPNRLDPLQLSKSFYSRAYFNMSALGEVFALMGMPHESLELLMGLEPDAPERPRFKPSARTYQLLPRMLGFALDKLRFERQIEAYLPRAEAAFRAVPVTRAGQMSEPELLIEVERLCGLTQEAAYHNILGPLLMQVYNRMLTGQLKKAGVDDAHFDVTRGLAEMNAVDPKPHLAGLRRIVAGLTPAQRETLASLTYAELKHAPDFEPLCRELDAFLQRFGHLSDSGNDFSIPPWRENPDLTLKLALATVKPGEAEGRKSGFEELPLPAFRRALLGPLYRRARSYRLYREQISSLYTFGYGLFRELFLALGNRFVQRGLLAARDDIFFLTLAEIRGAVNDEVKAGGYSALVIARRAELESVRHITPPTTLFGDQPLPVETQPGDTLTGTPTSRGYYRGPARIIRGLHEFDRLQAGDVLVIPYSDVGWTPLFAKAGAVIAESGGMLSHSSIVAREYNIPAVVSVHGACNLPDGAPVTVDGFRGVVIVHQDDTATA
jgi:pyruvate,water dikinase